MVLPKALVHAAFAAWASLVSLSGCAMTPDAAPMPQAIAPEPPAEAFVEPAPEVPAALPEIKTTRTVRVLGHATLPRAVAGLANAKDGKLVGAPVAVFDVASGRKLATGVTFYDGSFVLEVPQDLGKRPVLITVALVDGTTDNPLFSLAAPLQLAPELGEQRVEVGPASTAWYALLYRMAARRTNAPPPDWTSFTPGATARVLGGMIVGSEPQAVAKFSLFAAGDDGLAKPATAGDLKLAIQGFVERLVASAQPTKE
jgi:hypothetical protein